MNRSLKSARGDFVQKKFQKSVMFGLVINGRPAIFCGSGSTGIVEQSPGKWICDIVAPVEVCFAYCATTIASVDCGYINISCLKFTEWHRRKSYRSGGIFLDSSISGLGIPHGPE